MDKTLVLKILGKKGSVDLGDQVYNLIEITEHLRSIITLKSPISDEVINMTVKQFENVYKVILEIKENFGTGENVIGYTNSKIYLSEFINKLEVNIKGLIEAFEPFNRKEFVYYTNTIIDLALDY